MLIVLEEIESGGGMRVDKWEERNGWVDEER